MLKNVVDRYKIIKQNNKTNVHYCNKQQPKQFVYFVLEGDYRQVVKGYVSHTCSTFFFKCRRELIWNEPDTHAQLPKEQHDLLILL